MEYYTNPNDSDESLEYNRDLEDWKFKTRTSHTKDCWSKTENNCICDDKEKIPFQIWFEGG